MLRRGNPAGAVAFLAYRAGHRGVARQIRGGLGPAGDLELGQDRGYVVLHGLFGEPQLPADLSVGLSLGNEGQDSLLLSRQAGQLLVAHGLALAQPVEHRAGDARVEQAPTGAHLADRVDELAAADLLEHVAGGAGHDRGEQRLVVRERREHQHLRLLEPGADLTRGLDAATVRQPDVHHHHVRARALSLRDGLLHGAGLRHDGKVVVGVDQGFHAIAHDLVVVDEHDANPVVRHPGYRPTAVRPRAVPAVPSPRGRSAFRRSIGTESTTRVPLPGAVITRRRPSMAVARARMLRSPEPRALAPGSNPVPSSRMVRITFPLRLARLIEARPALACRVTLESASRVNCTISCDCAARAGAASGSTFTSTWMPDRVDTSSASARSAWSSWRSARMPGCRPKM